MSVIPDFNEKQIQILLVAESLFAEKGFDGTSIRNIAKMAKINIAMVSYYFGSKERLLESLISYRTKDLKIQIENLLIEDLDPIAKINKLIAIYINDLRRSNFKSLEAIITEGQEKGVFRKDISIPLITPTILGTFFHFYMNKEYFMDLLNLKTEELYNNYIKVNLTKHIQQTIKALLIYES